MVLFGVTNKRIMYNVKLQLCPWDWYVIAYGHSRLQRRPTLKRVELDCDGQVRLRSSLSREDTLVSWHLRPRALKHGSNKRLHQGSCDREGRKYTSSPSLINAFATLNFVLKNPWETVVLTTQIISKNLLHYKIIFTHVLSILYTRKIFFSSFDTSNYLKIKNRNSNHSVKQPF